MSVAARALFARLLVRVGAAHQIPAVDQDAYVTAVAVAGRGALPLTRSPAIIARAIPHLRDAHEATLAFVGVVAQVAFLSLRLAAEHEKHGNNEGEDDGQPPHGLPP